MLAQGTGPVDAAAPRPDLSFSRSSSPRSMNHDHVCALRYRALQHSWNELLEQSFRSALESISAASLIVREPSERPRRASARVMTNK